MDYNIYNLPNDDGKSSKTPIADLIDNLVCDSSLSESERINFAISMLDQLNYKMEDYKKRALDAENKYEYIRTEKFVERESE